ncbi:MAG: WD40 repeat domain-containing protein [Xenococcaceae cyanobacterium]
MAKSFQLQHTLLNPTPNPGDVFGDSISFSGNNLLIGAPLDDTNGNNSGAAYLFNVNNGNLLQTFLSPVSLSDAPNDTFGNGVAIDGNNVLIGSRGDDSAGANTGAAYLFDATNGNLLQTFLNPTPDFNDNFCEVVAISGNNALVGALGDDSGATNSGAVHLFDAVTGSLKQTFENPTPAAGDFFGAFIAIDGDNVLIGAPEDDTSASNAGIAYLFDAVTGNLKQTFFNPTPDSDEFFGVSLAIDDNNVLIGSRANDVVNDGGIAYLFDATTGDLLETFFNPTPDIEDYFSASPGEGVAIKGDKILIGAQNDDLGATDSGAAYLYDTDGNLLQTFLNPEPNIGARFGHAVAIGENTLAVGADYIDNFFIGPGDDTIGGRTYVYQPDSKSVPEPSTLLGLGLIAGLGVLSRKRKKTIC